MRCANFKQADELYWFNMSKNPSSSGMPWDQTHELTFQSVRYPIVTLALWEQRAPYWPTGTIVVSCLPPLKNLLAHCCTARPEISNINIRGRPNAVSHSELHFRDTEAGFEWHSSPWGSPIFRARHDFPSHTYKPWKIHSNYHPKSHSSIAPTRWWGVQVAVLNLATQVQRHHEWMATGRNRHSTVLVSEDRFLENGMLMRQ